MGRSVRARGAAHRAIVTRGHVLVVTGASGVGKTTAVQALDACRIPGVRCFFFDSIGVPSAEIMERDYGGGERWQALATADWLARLGGLHRAFASHGCWGRVSNLISRPHRWILGRPISAARPTR
jgi:hypothetical protein